MIHTGGLPTEDDIVDTSTDGSAIASTKYAKTLMDVFALCHRWQLSELGELLESHLVRMVDYHNVEAMLEIAVLHGAPSLKSACLQKGKDCAPLQASLLAGKLVPAVAAELRRFLGHGE